MSDKEGKELQDSGNCQNERMVMQKPAASEEILDIDKQPDDTCPKIDEIIKAIITAYTVADKAETECMRYKPDCEHEDKFTDIRYELAGLEDDLEKLRTDNENIRKWGQCWKDLAKNLLDYYEPNWRNDRLSA